MNQREEELIRLLCTREEKGLSLLQQEYGGLLHYVVWGILQVPQDVEECMNDIFLGIWRNIDCFDESKGSFLNWAAGVARLEAIDTLRKVQREQKVVPLEEIEILQEDTTWSTFAQQELSKETEEILKCLSPKDRELFRRVFLDEEEPEEAGKAMGISRENVYVRIFRGKKKIRNKFGERKRA